MRVDINKVKNMAKVYNMMNKEILFIKENINKEKRREKGYFL